MLARATGRHRKSPAHHTTTPDRKRLARGVRGRARLSARVAGAGMADCAFARRYSTLGGDRTGQAVVGLYVECLLVNWYCIRVRPAWLVSKIALSESLKEEGRGVMGSARHNRLRDSLVVLEIALSLTLLVGAGLLFRSFLQLQQVSSGFDPQQVLTFRLAPSGDKYRDDPQYAAYFKQTIDSISAVPGVQTVSAINTLPLNPGGLPSSHRTRFFGGRGSSAGPQGSHPEPRFVAKRI